MTDPSFDDLTALMPNKTLSPIGSATKAPTHQEVDAALAELSANAAAIPSLRGDGELGHAILVLGDTRYEELSNNNIPFIPPQAPLANPVIRANPSYAQIEEARRVHAQETKEYKTYKMTELILRNMLLEATHSFYKSDFFTNELGYRVTLEGFIHHLQENYAKKSDKELQENKKEMESPWNVATEPIQGLFSRIERCRKFDPSIPESTYVRDTVNIICKNKGFDTAFETWEDKPEAAKLWINLKPHFAKAARTRNNKLELHSSTPYPGAANSASTPGTPAATPFDTLVSTVASLSKKFDNYVAASNTTSTSNNSSTTGTTRNNNRPPRTTNPAGGREPTTDDVNTLSYCWSHGFCKIIAGKDHHTSTNCKKKRVGHQTEATATNKMGGETRVCNSWHPTNNNTQNE